MSAPGEIRALTRVAPPDVAVITNVSPVHLQFFAGLEEIARAKKEILDGAKPDATAVLNGDDPLVMDVAAGFPGRKVLFGRGPACDVRAEGARIEGLRRLRVRPALREGLRPGRPPLRQRGRGGEPPGRRGRLPLPRPGLRRDPPRDPGLAALLDAGRRRRSGPGHPRLRRFLQFEPPGPRRGPGEPGRPAGRPQGRRPRRHARARREREGLSPPGRRDRGQGRLGRSRHRRSARRPRSPKAPRRRA